MRRPHIVSYLFSMAAILALTACQFPGLQKGTLSPSKPDPSKGVHIALALPVTGNLAPVAGRISRGAEIAKQEMAAQGIRLTIDTINTDAPDWQAKLQALPPECAVIGGPLRPQIYKQARDSGLVDRRIFFAFLNNLEPGDEGRRAWRFFPSPQDQIDALISFATDGMGMRSFGVFYPSDTFGTRMSALFGQTAARRSMPVQTAAYNPADRTSWSAAATPLIKPMQNGSGSSATPVPQTEFEALFVPDSWKNMDMVVSSLMYNGEDRLLLMGTTLWEQSIAGRRVANADKYPLAVFPVAWNVTAGPRVLAANNNFWQSLGYDFVRFAVNMAMSDRPSASEVTARANRAAPHLRALAPMNWDNAGVGHERLFVYRVTAAGMAPADVDDLKQTRTAIVERAALRMQGQPPEDAEGQPPVPPQQSPDGQFLPPASGTPAPAVQAAGQQPAQPVMSTTPQPSYKLRLPARPGAQSAQ